MELTEYPPSDIGFGLIMSVVLFLGMIAVVWSFMVFMDRSYSSALMPVTRLKESASDFYPVWQKIFYYLPEKDLLNSRLVHPSWNSVFLSLPRKSVRKGFRLRNPCPFERVQDLTNIYESEMNKPLLRLNMDVREDEYYQGPSFSARHQRILSEFFTSTAPFIQTLKVTISFVKMSTLPQETCFKFWNLKALQIEQVEIKNNRNQIPDSGKTVQQISDYFQNMIRGAPKLKSVEICNHISEYTEAEFDFDPICTLFIELSSVRFLKTLKLRFTSEQHFRSAAICLQSLKVEELDMKFDEKVIFLPETLNNILLSQSNSLKQFKMIKFQTNATESMAVFPRMQALETIYIMYPNLYDANGPEIPSSQELKFADISYVQHFPNLKRLNLLFWRGANSNEINLKPFLLNPMRPVTSVEEIKVMSNPISDYTRVYAKITLLFPRLRKLELNYHLDLNDIWDLIARLEELRSFTVNLCYESREHTSDRCLPCVIGKKVLGSRHEGENYESNKEKAQNRLRPVLDCITTRKPPCLDTIRVNCTQNDYDLPSLSLLIKVKNTGEFHSSIRIRRGKDESKIYWTEL